MTCKRRTRQHRRKEAENREETHLIKLSPNTLTRTRRQNPILRHIPQLGLLLLRLDQLGRQTSLGVPNLTQPLVDRRLFRDLGVLRTGGVDGPGEFGEGTEVETGTLALGLRAEGVGEGLGGRQVRGLGLRWR
jgi:hypothetical protein